MSALGLLFRLESSGVGLSAQGGDIRFRAPQGVITADLKALVTKHKPELVKMLRARKKFGYSEAALFPLIGKSVSTPQGSGELLSVFHLYCRVQIHETGAIRLYPPGHLIAWALSEFVEELAS